MFDTLPCNGRKIILRVKITYSIKGFSRHLIAFIINSSNILVSWLVIIIITAFKNGVNCNYVTVNCKLTYLQHLYLNFCCCKQKVINLVNVWSSSSSTLCVLAYIQTLVNNMDCKPTAALVTVSWNNGQRGSTCTCMFLSGLLANKCSFCLKFAWPIRKQKIVGCCFLSLLLVINITNGCTIPCYSIISNCENKRENKINLTISCS